MSSGNAIAEIERQKWLALSDLPAPDRSKPYLSCGYIEGGVVFWPDYISACCVAHSNSTGGTAPLAKFRGGKLPIADILATRKKIIDTHQAGGRHPDCDGCPHLVEAHWGAKDFLVDVITLAHYTHCNLKCRYCYTVNRPELGIKPKDVYNLLPTFQAMIDDGILSPQAVIRISGGEPTMLKEFEPLIDLISGHGPHIIVYTNAVLHSPALEKALSSGRVDLVLGIDAGSADVYQTVKGTNDVEKVWNTVASYAAANPTATWAKMILRYDNWQDVDAFVRRCEDAKVRRVYCDIEAEAFRRPEELPDVIRAMARLKYLCDRRGILTQYGEAGAQNLPTDILDQVREAYRELAQTEPEGRGLLFRQALLDRVGIDGWLYDHAQTLLGAKTTEAITRRSVAAFDAPDSDPLAVVEDLNQCVAEGFAAADLPLSDARIDLGDADFIGTGWGAAAYNNAQQRWRWIGPTGRSSVFVRLPPQKGGYVLRFFIHTARDMASLEALSVTVNGTPLAQGGAGWTEGYYAPWYVLKSDALPADGRVQVSFTLTGVNPVGALAAARLHFEAF